MASEVAGSAFEARAGRVVGRYSLHEEIAAGGMATVHFGRLLGPVGFARTVAIKRLHPQFAKDPEFVSMFLDEARLAARIHHPNVVPTLDVVATQGELFLVMEYVHGESLARLLRASKTPPPLPILAAVMVGALHGLHAAHEARDEHGQPLGLVHRDISPQNVLVGADGIPRVLDFGVAKATTRVQITQEGQLKGKLRYMSAEQARSERVDRRTDVYATGAVFYEALTGQKLIAADESAAVITQILMGEFRAPHLIDPAIPPALSALVMRAVSRDPDERFATAREFALAVEDAVAPATPTRVATWVEATMREALARRAAKVAEIESATTHAHPPPSALPPSSERPRPVSVSVSMAVPLPVTGAPTLVEPTDTALTTRSEPHAESTQSTALASNVSHARPPRARSWGLVALSVVAVAFGLGALVFRTRSAEPPVVAADPHEPATTLPSASAEVIAEPAASSPAPAEPPTAMVPALTAPATAVSSLDAAAAGAPAAAGSHAKPHGALRPPRPSGADTEDVYRTR